MIIVGIDPGTQRIGYGAVQAEGNTLSLLDAGLLRIRTKDPVKALHEIKQEMDILLARYHPEVVAVERLYFANNQKTAIAVAQARGVILLAATEYKTTIVELSPTEIKTGLTGYGSSDKKAVLKMVRLILREPSLEVIDDASDALASAIVAHKHGSIIRQEQKRT